MFCNHWSSHHSVYHCKRGQVQWVLSAAAQAGRFGTAAAPPPPVASPSSKTPQLTHSTLSPGASGSAGVQRPQGTYQPQQQQQQQQGLPQEMQHFGNQYYGQPPFGQQAQFSQQSQYGPPYGQQGTFQPQQQVTSFVICPCTVYLACAKLCIQVYISVNCSLWYHCIPPVPTQGFYAMPVAQPQALGFAPQSQTQALSQDMFGDAAFGAPQQPAGMLSVLSAPPCRSIKHCMDVYTVHSNRSVASMNYMQHSSSPRRLPPQSTYFPCYALCTSPTVHLLTEPRHYVTLLTT